ncbi:MAG TPA: hypothetical protein VF240_09750 [Pyrinomonadaceae bacterium]
MRITYHLLAAALFITAAAAAPPCFGRGAATTTDDAAAEQSARPARIFLILTSGTKTEVEEVAEKSEGFWFRRGNVWTLIDRSKVARVERELPAEKVAAAGAAPKAAAARWSLSDAARVESFFVKRFGRALPVTAFGQSGLHNRWGYDHRDSLDVGLHPDSLEGRELMAFLSGEGLPFMGFRSAIPGVASAPHIHIGLPSRRLTSR